MGYYILPRTSSTLRTQELNMCRLLDGYAGSEFIEGITPLPAKSAYFDPNRCVLQTRPRAWAGLAFHRAGACTLAKCADTRGELCVLQTASDLLRVFLLKPTHLKRRTFGLQDRR